MYTLIGASGGGGGASWAAGSDFGGGGGGGAILIASSRDITVNGQIHARGGSGGSGNSFAGDGAYGSGGAIKLVADRVMGSGILNVNSDANTASSQGRLRVEANGALACATPPSEPDLRISRIRLSSRQFASLRGRYLCSRGRSISAPKSFLAGTPAPSFRFQQWALWPLAF